MSETPSHGKTPNASGTYKIRIKGHLNDRWAEWFEGLSITREVDGTTLLQGPVADQTALHGLLRKIRDLGLPLVEVVEVKPGMPSGGEGQKEF